MKTMLRFVLTAAVAIGTAADSQAMRWYSPNAGKWLSRDPIGEKGGLNLYGFVANNPISVVDKLGLQGYQLVSLPPTGLWLVTLEDVTFDSDGSTFTLKGFRSRYIPSDGKQGRPDCPCKKQSIFIAQVVNGPLYPVMFDVAPSPQAGWLPPHKPDDPIPGYYFKRDYYLTLTDAPHYGDFKGKEGTWEFEDCAICRTHADANSTLDQVLGCVKFTFHRTGETTAEISTRSIRDAEAPGTLWRKAVDNWKSSGK
ncbi:MAG TPA: RHS repeat-associated core domain-containing protein [Verrucomicrobiae bacterium]|jgi:hypothetical protein|nr:RHS repeat-associated core domain-containing protein [Verrucomicrobiae bacterium]